MEVWLVPNISSDHHGGTSRSSRLKSDPEPEDTAAPQPDQYFRVRTEGGMEGGREG